MLLNLKGKCLQCKNPTWNIISVHTGKEYGRGVWIFRLFPALLIFVSYWFLVSCCTHRAACGGGRGNEARGDRWRQVVEYVARNDRALMR